MRRRSRRNWSSLMGLEVLVDEEVADEKEVVLEFVVVVGKAGG